MSTKPWKIIKNNLSWIVKGKGGNNPINNKSTIDGDASPKPVNAPSEPSSDDNNKEFSWFSHQPANKPRVHGFESRILSLKKLLAERENESRFKAVGVFGPRGVGKTTLSQVYYYGEDELLAKKNEDSAAAVKEVQRPSKPSFPRVWISMSEKPNPDENTINGVWLLKRILEKLGVEGERIANITKRDRIVEALLYVLRLQLTGKKYLVVIDDIQQEDPFLELSLAPSKPNSSGEVITKSANEARFASALPKWSGGTVVVTVREEEKAKKIAGDGNVFRVLPLSDPDSLWKIFKDTVDRIGIDSDGRKFDTAVLSERIEKFTPRERQLFRKDINVFETLQKKVVSKCNGLPIAARLMAETMPDQLARKERDNITKNKQDFVPLPENKERVEDQSKGTASEAEGKKTDDEEKDEASDETSEKGQDHESDDEEKKDEAGDETSEKGEDHESDDEEKKDEAGDETSEKGTQDHGVKGGESTDTTTAQKKEDKRGEDDIQEKPKIGLEEGVSKKEEAETSPEKEEDRKEEETKAEAAPSSAAGTLPQAKEDSQVQEGVSPEKEEDRKKEETKAEAAPSSAAGTLPQAKEDSQVKEGVSTEKEEDRKEEETKAEAAPSSAAGTLPQAKEDSQVKEGISPEKAVVEEKPEQIVEGEETKSSTTEEAAVSNKKEEVIKQ